MKKKKRDLRWDALGTGREQNSLLASFYIEPLVGGAEEFL